MNRLQMFHFVLYSQFLFFEGRNPGPVPIGVRHFSGDSVFKFSMVEIQIVLMDVLLKPCFHLTVGPEK